MTSAWPGVEDVHGPAGAQADLNQVGNRRPGRQLRLEATWLRPVRRGRWSGTTRRCVRHGDVHDGGVRAAGCAADAGDLSVIVWPRRADPDDLRGLSVYRECEPSQRMVRAARPATVRGDW